MRRFALALLVVAGCSKSGGPPAAGTGAVVGGGAALTSEPAVASPPEQVVATPQADPAELERRRSAAVAKYQVRAGERERLDTAYGSAIIQLALVRKNGGPVDDKVVHSLWKRLKAGVCFGEPKLNMVDRTKKKKPATILEPLRSGSAAKLETARTKCPGGKQPLALSVRLDSFEEVETAGKETTTRVKPGVSVTPGSKADPSQLFEYEMDTLERTVSATGEIGIESRVFPYKVNERSRDKGNAEMTLPSGLHIAQDQLDVRPMSELDDEVTQRILAVVQQALDRHFEGLRKAYTTMAIQTATQDDGASQEHHALEVVALGGRLDENPALSAKLAERYEMPASELAVAVAALHLD